MLLFLPLLLCFCLRFWQTTGLTSVKLLKWLLLYWFSPNSSSLIIALSVGPNNFLLVHLCNFTIYFDLILNLSSLQIATLRTSGG